MGQDIPLRLAIDFDGVLHDTKKKLPGYKLGQPIVGAVEAVQQLKNEGALIIVHSLWAGTPQKRRAISEWCRYFEIPYDDITNTKPDCDFYIDDRGLRFVNWAQALAEIKLRRES
jgi:hypothetical protein